MCCTHCGSSGLLSYLRSVQNTVHALFQTQEAIIDFEEQMVALSRSASLFEVNVPDYKQLKACRKDIVLLKELWDMALLVGHLRLIVTSSLKLTLRYCKYVSMKFQLSVSQVKGNMDDWKTTLWKDINVEDMDLETKKYAKDVKGLDKEMRVWDAFSGLDSMVKNMLTSLRAIGDLQNPAIRDRHWHQLMVATKVLQNMFTTCCFDHVHINIAGSIYKIRAKPSDILRYSLV